MNWFLHIAGILCILLGLIHSVLGEYLIFQSKREKGRLVPTKRNEGLSERHLRILWATWHLASFFGWCLGAILIKMGTIGDKADGFHSFIIQSIAYSMLAGSLLVLVGTKGKHPGWIVLLGIAVLTWVGLRSM